MLVSDISLLHGKISHECKINVDVKRKTCGMVFTWTAQARVIGVGGGDLSWSHAAEGWR